MLRSRMAGLIVVAAVLISCGGGGDGGGGGGGGTDPEGPGGVSLYLTVPQGRVDGIVLVRLDNGQYDSVAKIPGQSRRVGAPGQQHHIMVRAGLSGKVLLGRVCVKHLEDPTSYPTPQLIQVAGGQGANYATRSVAEYGLVLDESTVATTC